MKKFAVGLILFTLQAKAEILPPQVIIDNNKAAKSITDQQPGPAQNLLNQAMVKNPLNPVLQYNLALSFQATPDPEKAKQAYQSALEQAQDPETRFAILYNLGTLAQQAQQKGEALNWYQMALKENPNSKETKTNIEMMMKSDDQQKQQQQNQDQQDQKDKKDQKNQEQQKKDQGKDKDKDSKDQKGQGDQQKPDQEKDDAKKDSDKKDPYAKNQKPQPKPFKSNELTPGDVQKILGEVRNQEQKIRAEFSKKDQKEQPRDKDW